ncbi:MAG: Na+/H+ antiporter NhaC family protein [Lachnospiraceae bacterium]|nr:Na+/H+ antiporter NhaC family protein [Lachnospiraceae bacterium]
MSGQKIFVLVLMAILVALVVVTINTPGTIEDPASYEPKVFATTWALLPPVIAIALALITKEVYSSLFVGIVVGGLLYSNFNLELMMNTVFFNENGGMVYKLADSWNVGILIFLVVLGIMVAIMNKAGGSAAFGEWASKRIKTKVGAQLATIALGVMIFVDDYFNCLTVGNVMRPVTDKHKVSRSKLSYLIDATAAPVCIIAPISSWAAAVTSSVPEDSGINGFTTFLKTIPYNYYALFAIITMIFFAVTKVDFGLMKKHELNALKGDLFSSTDRTFEDTQQEAISTKGKVIDLVLPVLVLIAACIMSMVYTGGFFAGESFVNAFANSDASAGLVMGSFIALIFTFMFYMFREVISFQEFMECVPVGFKMMVSPILILTCAWTLSGMTGLLGADVYVAGLVEGSAAAMQLLLPAVIFLVAVGLAFATGTSWGTFGILIPIVLGVFGSGEMMVISIAACLSGAVCGDHCSPISDTTIMASAGGQCNHVNHVSTQLPYALLVAAVSFVTYLIAAFVKNAIISLLIGLVILLIVLFIVKIVSGTTESADEGVRS